MPSRSTTRQASERKPRLLIIDGSYDFDTIRRLGLEQSVLSRDLDGFFEHVWTVHPFGSAARASGDIGKPDHFAMTERHSFIQAKSGRYSLLEKLPALNFLAGQVALVASLVALVRRERIAVVRAGDPLWVGLLGWIVAKAGGARFAIRINANNDKVRETTGKPIYPRLLRSTHRERKVERFLLPRAALVAAPNQDNVEFAVANGADRRRTVIFPYGNLLAPAYFSDPGGRERDATLFNRLGIAPNSYLLCVSRLQALKFPEDSLHCLAAAAAAGHDLKLVLAGEGEMRSELEVLAAQLGISGRVLLPGNLDQLGLAQLYTNAAVVISPLTGRALSEAALCGAPIVAYDLDWQRDLVRTGESGILVPFRDQDALSRSVISLVEDRALAKRLGAGARARALELFDPQAMLANERNAYANLLSGRPQ